MFLGLKKKETLEKIPAPKEASISSQALVNKINEAERYLKEITQNINQFIADYEGLNEEIGQVSYNLAARKDIEEEQVRLGNHLEFLKKDREKKGRELKKKRNLLMISQSRIQALACLRGDLTTAERVKAGVNQARDQIILLEQRIKQDENRRENMLRGIENRLGSICNEIESLKSEREDVLI